MNPTEDLRTTDGPASARPPTGADDSLLGLAVEEYLALLEAGRRPGRREFLGRYPGIADALAECLDGVDFVHGAASGLGQDAAGSPASSVPGMPPLGVLGDFRLVREVGRGGMGVVYEAEQVSLGRRVALKVLPLAAVLDERHLRRFRVEAQAAGQLHHTNIVPVYAVGSERGVHYYAMQFIDGQPLTAVVEGLKRLAAPGDRGAAGLGEAETAPATAASGLPPTVTHTPTPMDPRALSTLPGVLPVAGPAAPSASAEAWPDGARSSASPAYFRSVARLGIQAAEALEHAHAHGVVHRDIKPANLLLDGRGNLWVADFGLARLQDDGGLTLTGDVLGTLRYMSPEQAAGRKGLDHRTDVYSLGATLYELLALRPAVVGDGHAEILRAIAESEAAPLRRRNGAVPRDLATIVAKAMAKEPARRYATAGALAADLRAFLEHRPIAARRPGPAERVAKWVRRHRVVAAASACVTVASLVAMGFALLAHERELGKLKAEVAADRADRRGLEARVDALVAEAQRRGSGFAPDYVRAEALLTEAIAHRPVDADLYLYRGGTRHELHRPAEAIADLERSLELRPRRNPAAHWMISLCALQLGQSEKAGRHRAEAEKDDPDSVEALVAQALGLAYDERGLALMDRAIEREPFNPTLYYHRGRIAANLVIHRSELRFYERAVGDLEKALKARPGDPQILNPLCYCLLHDSHLINMGSWPAAVASAKRLLDSWHARDPHDPLALWLLADYHILRTDFGAAADAARRGQRLAPDNPELASLLGRALQGQGRYSDALRWYDRSLELRPRLMTHAWRARCLGLHLGQPERALRELREADRRIPAGSRRTEDWWEAYIVYSDLGRDDDALRTSEAWIREMPDSSMAHLARAWKRLWGTGDYRGAADDCTRAIELGSLLPAVYTTRAESLVRLKRVDEALAALDEHIHGPSLRAGEGGRTQEQEMSLACEHMQKTHILEGSGRRDEAKRAEGEAWAAAMRALSIGPLEEGAWSFGVIGGFHGCLAELVRRRAGPEDAERILEALGEETFEHANPWLWRELALAYSGLGLVLSRGDRPRAEELAWRQAIRVHELLLAAPDPPESDERGLIRWHLRLADLLRRRGRTGEADELDRRAAQAAARWREAVERQVGQRPEDPALLNRVAWHLATWPVPALRDPARAAELSRRAVAKLPKSAGCWDTLGVALYRAGDWDGAAQALARSRELAGRDEPATVLVLAMAQWRRGRLDEARLLFDGATRALAQPDRPPSEETIRFQDEAAALLGSDSMMPDGGDAFAR